MVETGQIETPETVTDAKAKILVVDDRPDKLLAFQATLEELGEEVFLASSGDEALKLILVHEFAVILMDVNMPGMDGFETAVLIRQRRRSAHIPIIFITAYADEMRIAQGYSLGAVDYILSPVIPQVLQTKVRVLCDLFKMTAVAKRQGEERVALVKAQAARAAAEEETRRSAFLAQASSALTASLEFKTTVQTLARLPIGVLADRAMVVVLTDAGEIDWVELADAENDPITSRTLTHPIPESLARAVTRVYKSRATEIIALTADGCAFRTRDARNLARSNRTTLIPLIARSRRTTAGASVLAVLCLSQEIREGLLARANLSLAEELAARASVALENAILYERLQDDDRKKNEFLAMLAHELRNPLAPIGNAVSILRMAGEDSARRAWCAEVLQRQHNQLVRLVDDLLDVSRITNGRINLQFAPVEVASILAIAVETIRPLTESRRQQLLVEIDSRPIKIWADAARVAQVLSNLLNNASKYTPEGGKVGISVCVQNDAVIFRVHDDGIGIPADMLAKVFDLFMQGEHGYASTQSGLGIGLTLVRRLVEAHNGSVQAYSAGANCGTEIVVTMPLMETGALPTTERSGSDSVNSSKSALPNAPTRVLVIDDNTDAGETTAMVLRLEGCEVEIAADGPSALDLLSRFNPDLILLDIGLPGMDGYEVARRIRGLVDGNKPYLVAVTGYGRPEDIARSTEAGFDRHLVKPLDIGSLITLLKNVSARPQI